MINSRSISALLVVLLAVCPVSGGNRDDKTSPNSAGENSLYFDISAFFHDVMKVQDRFVFQLMAARNSAAVAVALNAYADSMEELSKTARRLEKKYPRFDADNPPEELSGDYAKLRDIADRISRASLRIMENALDPEVSTALQRLEKKKVKTIFFPEK